MLTGFAEDAKLAIATAPDYFVRWYTVKSIGLCMVTALAAFLIGRETVKHWRRST